MSRAREIADLVGGTTPDIILKTSDGAILNLQTSDTTVTADSVLGEINFQAPDEASGTDAILIASKIQAVAEGTFSSSSNATSLVFTTANSAAAGTASGKMTFTSGGELILKDTDTADGSSPTITLQSGDTDIAADDVLGTINFQAPDEGAGTDAILVAAGIAAVSEGDFSSSNNATKLSFRTGASETATEKMTISSTGATTITTADNNPQLILVCTDTDASTGPKLELNRNPGEAGADGDNLGQIEFYGYNDASQKSQYAYIFAEAADVADGNEDVRFGIGGLVAGADSSLMTFMHGTSATGADPEMVFNDTSRDINFRVESDGEANMFNIDGAANSIGIGETGLAAYSSAWGTVDNTRQVSIKGSNYGVLHLKNSGTPSHYTMGVGDGSLYGAYDAVGGKHHVRYISNTGTVFNDDGTTLDFRVESQSKTHMLFVDADQNSVAIGNSTANYAFHVNENRAGNYVAGITNDGNNVNRYGMIFKLGTDDGSGTNTYIAFDDGNGSGVGAITGSGGTITYGQFTAVHPAILPDADNESGYAYGTLLDTTEITYSKRKNEQETERGVRYKVVKSASANSRKVLGAYSGKDPKYNNEHFVNVLGDGHILCNNSGGNIAVGDGICTSAAAGIGQKATASPSMIIGIAQEAVTFSNSTETKLVPVQYGLQQFTPWS